MIKSVNNGEMWTSKIEYQQEENLTTKRHDTTIVTIGKDKKKYCYNSVQSYKTLKQEYVIQNEDILDIDMSEILTSC